MLNDEGVDFWLYRELCSLTLMLVMQMLLIIFPYHARDERCVLGYLRNEIIMKEMFLETHNWKDSPIASLGTKFPLSQNYLTRC